MAFSGCRKLQQFSDEPALTFVNFVQAGADSARIIVSFTDGDGDIGLRASDTLPPHDFNLFLEYFELQNGEWIKPELATPFYYRIPPLSESDNGKALQGEIEVNLSPFYYAPGADSIRYEVRLRDFALNESNIITTDLILVPQ